jgi:very-short-patch-repair endonuclease
MPTEKQLRIRPEIRTRARKLRRPQTPAEQTLWRLLRDRRMGELKFRRQHPIGPFIADFCCAAARLVIELDGDSHASQGEYDQARSDWLQAQGYRVIRFTNQEVSRDKEAVLQAILDACRSIPGAQTKQRW